MPDNMKQLSLSVPLGLYRFDDAGNLADDIWDLCKLPDIRFPDNLVRIACRCIPAVIKHKPCVRAQTRKLHRIL